MSMRSFLRDQRGVVMVTVLSVAAALTALVSAAAFVAVQDLRASRDDRTGSQSLAYAEAGIDRLLLELRRGTNITWKNISKAGCDGKPPVTVTGSVAGTSGSYTASMVAANCATASEDPTGKHDFVITSEGSQPAARRIVRQAVTISPLGLPIGVYAYERIEGNGTINMQHISMVTAGSVTGRQQIAFSGTDPFYTLADFYGGAQSTTTNIPAAIHAIGDIEVTQGNKPEFEHREGQEPNCSANPVPKGGTDGQSLWDGSKGTRRPEPLPTGCVNWPGSSSPGPNTTPPLAGSKPPRAFFTEDDRKRVAPKPDLDEQDYLTLREAAKSDGFYCTPGLLPTTLSCRRRGGEPFPVAGNTITSNELGTPGTDLPKVFVAYIDFPADGSDYFSRAVTWKASVQSCSEDRNLNRSMVLVVRNGSVTFSGGPYLTGAVMVPQGNVDSSGSYTVEGTVIARRILSSGTATLKLSECWVHNLPGPFLTAVPQAWSEVDR